MAKSKFNRRINNRRPQELDYCLAEERLLTSVPDGGGLETWTKELEAHITKYGAQNYIPCINSQVLPEHYNNSRSYCGDLNGDGGFNVLDIVALVNCVLSGVCVCQGDMNGDGGYNVLDVVALTNCVLAENCHELSQLCCGGEGISLDGSSSVTGTCWPGSWSPNCGCCYYSEVEGDNENKLIDECDGMFVGGYGYGCAHCTYDGQCGVCVGLATCANECRCGESDYYDVCGEDVFVDSYDCITYKNRKCNPVSGECEDDSCAMEICNYGCNSDGDECAPDPCLLGNAFSFRGGGNRDNHEPKNCVESKCDCTGGDCYRYFDGFCSGRTGYLTGEYCYYGDYENSSKEKCSDVTGVNGCMGARCATYCEFEGDSICNELSNNECGPAGPLGVDFHYKGDRVCNEDTHECDWVFDSGFPEECIHGCYDIQDGQGIIGCVDNPCDYYNVECIDHCTSQSGKMISSAGCNEYDGQCEWDQEEHCQWGCDQSTGQCNGPPDCVDVDYCYGGSYCVPNCNEYPVMDCCPIDWIADGTQDCVDQWAGCDLSCYTVGAGQYEVWECNEIDCADGGDCEYISVCTFPPFIGGEYDWCGSCKYKDHRDFGGCCCDSMCEEWGMTCAGLENMGWNCKDCECNCD